MSVEDINPARELRRKYADIFREAWKNRHQSANRMRFTVREADFLPAVLAVSERPTPVAPRVVVWSLVSLVVAAIVWSIFGQIDVVVTATGRTIAVGRTHPVQSLETQIVTKVFVTEGQIVREGDPLIEADRASADADLARHISEVEQAERSVVVFGTLLNSVELGFVGEPGDIASAIADADPAVRQLVSVKWHEYSSRRARAAQELRRRRAEEEVLATALRSAQQRLDLRAKLATDYRNMVAAGVAARHAWVERQIVLDDLHRDIAQTSAQLDLAREASAVGAAELMALTAEVRAFWSDRLFDARKELSAARAERTRSEARVRNSVIRASTSGKVQQIGALAAGHVVQSGQVITAIVPDAPIDEVEVQIESRDIGFIQNSQPVSVKISAYDYTRYGTLSGKVILISDDAIADDKGNLRFIARIKLDSSVFRTGEKIHTLTPGMEATADILIGRRAVIAYFLSPIVKTVSEAIRER